VQPEKEVFLSIADMMKNAKLLNGELALDELKNVFNDLEYN